MQIVSPIPKGTKKKCWEGFQVSELPSFQAYTFPSFQVSKWEGGRDGGKEGGPMRGLGTDIRANERPQNKLHPMAQTDRQTDKHGD